MESTVIDIIRKRKSIRKYTNFSISNSVICELLKCGDSAPSGKNRRPWKFNVIKDRKALQEISKHTAYSRFLCDSSVLILVYGKFDDSYSKDKDLISIGCCVQNILLAATCMGYGSCVIGELYGRKIECIESIESVQGQLVCGICIGVTKNEKAVNEICEIDKIIE